MFPLPRHLRRIKDARLAGHIGHWWHDGRLTAFNCVPVPVTSIHFYQFWELCEEKCNSNILAGLRCSVSVCHLHSPDTVCSATGAGGEYEQNKENYSDNEQHYISSSISWLIDLAKGVYHSGKYICLHQHVLSFELCVTHHIFIIIFQWSMWEPWRNEREAN